MDPGAPTAASPLILVADDVSANVELLFDQLHVLGFRAIGAHDGPSALAACFEHRPDLCILDVSMPAGDLGVDDRSTGFEVCRRIKRDPRTKSIPVIFVTALSDTNDRVKAIEAGGDDFLTKPHHRLVLGARVRSLLRLKATTDALEQSYRKLRELEKMRDDLMKMIVHDLKTPLTSVLATLEMLIDGDFGGVNDPQRKALGDAEGKADDLLSLIGDLLEVWRLEEASLALELQPISPAALLTELVHEWSMRFQQEGATATVDVADDAPVFSGDKVLLKRVFANLIQNALTHTGRAVRLALSARRDGENVLFTVADNGPGIPEEYHELIFRKFERVANPSLPRTRSSGLGLAFCKLAVDAHGGRIWVRSAGDDQGSAFHVSIPPGADRSGARCSVCARALCGRAGRQRMKVLLHTFGCRANAYDSEAVRAMVERAGHEVVDDATAADVAVFNSCAVTAAAEADLRKAVRRAARRNPALRTTIMGCASALPERPGDQSLAALPTVSALVAGADLAAVAESIGLVPEPAMCTTAQAGTRAVLRIQDGCDEHCTFCATTLARGANRSRRVDEIVDEATRLAERHSEIVITGIHIGTYGTDIGSSLGELMERLVTVVPTARFRLTSVEATEVCDRLIDLWAGAPRRLAPSLHAPLQSGSDGVLRRMGRHWYTSRSYASAVELIASRVPCFGLGADVITGFPGEREQDHHATVALVRELPFSYLHVFPYSVRPGTAAERLPSHIPASIASSRSAELRDLGGEKAAAYAAARGGTVADVVILGGSEAARDGMTEDYLTVAVPGHLPRGTRLDMRLRWAGGRLQATPNNA